MRRDQLYQQLGKRIALARSGKLSQLELARKIGMSRPAIANIERGEQQIYVHQLIAIADELGLALDALLSTIKFVPVEKADVSVSGDKVNKAQERAIKEIVSSITISARKAAR